MTAWDYDAGEGSLRPLAPAPGDYVFGGGESDGPRIMDDARLEEAPQGAPAPAGGIGR